MRKTSKLIILSFLVTISTGYLPNTIINTISNTTKAQAEETGKRKALVIGNKNYSNGDELKNTINDANAISSKLSKLGFEVSNYSNLETRDDMRRKLLDFNKKINEGDTVFFYYSGHGIQIEDKNYLIPTKSELEVEEDVSRESLEVDYVVEVLKKKSKFIFIVLDACRNNPFKTRGLNAKKGLQPIRADILGDKQVTILYATKPNEVAMDQHPTKRNLGLFAGELIEVIDKENVKSDDVFKEVGKRVKEVSNNTQTPWIFAPEFFDEFYFNRGNQVASIAVPRVTATPREESPEVVVTNVYGSVDVSSKTGGILYIDGKRISEIGEGQEVSISKIKVGYRKLKMEYEGKSEEKEVYVERDSKVKVSFEYKRQIARQTPMPTPEPVYEEQVPQGFVKVEGGTFQMGDRFGDGPVHSVKVDSFYIGKYEVTQKEYKAVMGSNPSSFKGDNLPVESVSFNDAIEFCNKYNKLKGLPNAYDSDGNIINWKSYRLPTEAEWEYAAKGGNKSKGYKYSGSNNLNEVAVYQVNSYNKGSGSSEYGTHKVGSMKPNELGIYDMSGNVWEWVSDWYDDKYYDNSTTINPYNNKLASYRVSRGGSWRDYAFGTRVSYRYYNSPTNGRYNLGFRLSRTAP